MGTVRIVDLPTVTEIGDDDYLVVESNSVTSKIKWGDTSQKEGIITLSTDNVSVNASTPTATVTFTTNSDGIPTVTSSDTNIATASISGTTITITGVETGTTTIVLNIPATTHYTACTAVINVESVFSKTYTIRLDISDSNPETWGTYIDCNVTQVSAGGGENEIDDFMGYYPCMLKNGIEGVKLNPNNYAQDIDGNSVDITSGSSGDVMVYFPSKGYKISWYDSTHLDISITDEENKTGYVYGTYKGNAYKGFYHSAYEGFVLNNKLTSLSEKTPSTNQTIGTFRTQAQANGTGYEQRTYKELTYLQCCALIKYKGRNMQIAHGRGFVDGNSAAATTGGTNTRGLNYGETTGKVQMKLFGVEDFWGNIYDFIDGIFSDASRNILVADGNFNDTGDGYTNQGSSGFSSDTGGYMSKPKATTTDMGFCPAGDGISGSATTYFCDNANVTASRLARFGGDWDDADSAGLFRLIVNLSASNAYAIYGARLMFFKVA